MGFRFLHSHLTLVFSKGHGRGYTHLTENISQNGKIIRLTLVLLSNRNSRIRLQLTYLRFNLAHSNGEGFDREYLKWWQMENITIAIKWKVISGLSTEILYLIVWLVDWLIGWLIDWSIDWLIDRSTDRLIDWSIDLIDWLIDWLIDLLIDWLIDETVSQSFVRTNDLSIDLSISWSFDRCGCDESLVGSLSSFESEHCFSVSVQELEPLARPTLREYISMYQIFSRQYSSIAGLHLDALAFRRRDPTGWNPTVARLVSVRSQ